MSSQTRSAVLCRNLAKIFEILESQSPLGSGPDRGVGAHLDEAAP